MTLEAKYKEIHFDQHLSKIVVLTDITSIIQVETVKTIEKMSSIVIATTSHDMRTPLNTILNMHNFIKRGLTNE